MFLLTPEMYTYMYINYRLVLSQPPRNPYRLEAIISHDHLIYVHAEAIQI